MIELSELEKAFAAVKSAQCCRAFLTGVDVNACHEGDFLLSAAVNVYFKKNRSLENIKLLLDLGANPLCGSWNETGFYLNYSNLMVAAHLDHLKCLEMAALMDCFELVQLLVLSPKMNATHVRNALRKAPWPSDSRVYLSAVLDQCQQVRKLTAANAPTRYYHRPVAKPLLAMEPLAPILVLKGLENNSLDELASLCATYRRSMHDVRVVFFNQQSTASMLPLELMRLAASYVVDFSPLECANLRRFGAILRGGFQAETWYSGCDGFRRVLPSNARW
jgi:hypothetical protein